MPIIQPKEYPVLKAQGLISLEKQPDGQIRVTIDRGESEEYGKAAILSWLADERKSLTDQVAILDAIKADIDPL
jgi:hypothetical protein